MEKITHFPEVSKKHSYIKNFSPDKIIILVDMHCACQYICLTMGYCNFESSFICVAQHCKKTTTKTNNVPIMEEWEVLITFFILFIDSLFSVQDEREFFRR